MLKHFRSTRQHHLYHLRVGLALLLRKRARVRERRVKLGMDQSDLAEKAGTSRKWIVEVEQGKPRAEIGLVLRTLKTLGVSPDIAVDRAQKASSATEPRNVDINNILDSLKKRP